MNWDLILTATGINKILLIKLNLDYILSKEIFSQTGGIKGHQMIFPGIFLVCSNQSTMFQTKNSSNNTYFTNPSKTTPQFFGHIVTSHPCQIFH